MTFLSLAAALCLSLTPLPAPAAADWRAEVQAWRQQREAELKKPDGYLAVAGLFFLQPGANPVGARADAAVVLPDGAPATAGRLIYEDGRVRYEPAAGVSATLNDRPVVGAVTVSPADTKSNRPADRLGIGSLTLLLHRSGARLGVRLRDPDSKYRRLFGGLQWFPLVPAWRLQGRFIPYNSPRTVQIQNILGDLEDVASPGEVEVRVGGVMVRLAALQASRGRLWIIFSDASAEKETYRIRFLYLDPPDANRDVAVDFNRAYSAPCAFNPHTTCPLPPRQNRLTVAVPAGERKYAGPLVTRTP